MTGDPVSPRSPGVTPRPRSGRVRRFVNQSQTWTTQERSKVGEALADRRERSTWIGAGFDIAELDVHVGGGILAGAVAFRLFLFLVPFVYILFTAVGLGSTAASQDPAQLAKTLGITGVLASAVVNTQDISTLSQVLLLLGATVALIVTANSLAKTLFVVHWLVWGVPRMKPSGIRTIGTTIGLALVLSVLAVLANILRTHVGLLGSLLVALTLMGVSFSVWWWVSWRLPHAPVAPHQLIPGAVLVALGTEVLYLFTTYWIGHLVARKSHTYGAIGIALAVLLWVYVLGRVIVASAGVNAALWRRTDADSSVPSIPAQPPRPE
jgi:membrane protein